MTKQKKCAFCARPFTKTMPLQIVCGVSCAIGHSDKISKLKRARVNRENALADKHAKAAHRRAKEALKTPRQWASEVQAIVNRYVRLRDRHLPCCSCNKPASWGGQWHASHYRSVGAAPHLRFNLWNIHKGCSECNNHKSGNLIGYRKKLVKRIGVARVDWLETNQAIVRRDVEYLKRLKAVFSKKLRRLERRVESGIDG